MNMTQLIEVISETLSKIGYAGLPVDTRTVRYYAYLGIIPKPSKIGRDNHYDADYAKAVVTVRLLQSQGMALDAIKRCVDKTQLDQSISMDIDNMALSMETPEEEETEKMGKTKTATKKIMVSRRKPQQAERDKRPFVAWLGEEEVLSCEVTSYGEFNAIKPYVTLGSAFAFVNDVPAGSDLAKSIHRLLCGQKEAGEFTRGVLYASEEGLHLPGVILKGRGARGEGISAIVPDKGVYEEGDGVASLLVFSPSSALLQRTVTVRLDGVTIDEVGVDMDANGCSIVRVPTLVAGKYEVELDDESRTKCSFATTRYELAPLSVVVSGMEKSSGKVNLTMEAETYGRSYGGEASVSIGSSSPVECKFREGLGRVSVDLGDMDGELSALVMDKKNHSLVAMAPLPGTRKHERSDSTVSSMGRVVTVSMIGTANSNKARGLFFERGAHSNTPVALHECISGCVTIETIEKVEGMVVVVRDPISGEANVKEFGDRRKGWVSRIRFNSPLAIVHVGGFVNGEAWEGSAVVVRPSKNEVELSAPAQASPGDKVRISVKSKGKASVLLKVRDRRVRAHYEPMEAVASSAKKWIDWAIGQRQTGTARGEMKSPRMTASMGGILRSSGVVGSSDLYGGGVYGSGNAYRSAPLYMVSEESSTVQNMVSTSGMTGPSGLHGTTGSRALFGASGMEEEELTGGQWAKLALADMAIERPRGVSGFLGATKEDARLRFSDLVYCDLIHVDGKAEVEVMLPDAMGLYDVKAFAVSGTDWSEAETAIRVEKDVYIEPSIPQVVDVESSDKCRAVLVRTKVGCVWHIKVNGEVCMHENRMVGEDCHIEWDAVPGSHDVTLFHPDGSIADRVTRVVEALGKETVLSQEMRILRKGEEYDVDADGALSVVVLPGLDSELNIAVNVLNNFEYACCEQSSATIAAAAMAVLTGDESSRAKGYEGLVKGAARMTRMYQRGKGFLYYPDGSMNEWASKCAANRLEHVCGLLGKERLPSDVKKAVDSLREMSSDVVRIHGQGGYDMDGPIASRYYGNKRLPVGEAQMAINAGASGRGLAEAAYAVACLTRQGNLEEATGGANKVAKSMGGTMGGGWHGTCESLAYMYMVRELDKAGVVPGANGKARVNGKSVKIADATRMRNVSTVMATSGAVAIRVSRLETIDLGKANSSAGIQVSLEDGYGKASGGVEAGRVATMRVKLVDGYEQGDVLCVVLPECLSYMVGGGKAKKFTVDFAGENEACVTLVAHNRTDKPQRFAAVVRNMYQPHRLGSVGLMEVEVR